MAKQTKKQNKIVKSAKRRTSRIASSIKGFGLGIINLPKSLVGFLKGVYEELKLVKWLSSKDTLRWTSAVIATAFALGGLIALLDLGLYNLRELLFKI